LKLQRRGAAWYRAVLVASAASLLSTLLWYAGALESWEARSWDIRVRALAEPGPATDQIRLILLDQPSLDWARRESGLGWPWPRELHGALIDFVARGEPRALIMDVLFIEPSVYGVTDDQNLAKAMAHRPVVAALFGSGSQQGAESRWPDHLPRPRVRFEGEWQRPALDGLTLPIPEVAAAARALGNAQAEADADGIYRRLRPLENFDSQWLPNLALAGYGVGRPDRDLWADSHTLHLGDTAIPLDAGGQILLRYRGPSGTYQALSAAAVLQSELRLREGLTPVIDPEEFRDRYVLFGFSAPGLLDLRPTPVGAAFAGVEVQATLLDNLLGADPMRPFPAPLTFLLVVVLSGGAARMLAGRVSAGSSALIGLSWLAVPGVLAFALYLPGYWLHWMWLQSAMALTVPAGWLLNYAVEGRRRRFLRSAFQHYLSPGVIEQILREPERLRLGGERKTLTFFFTDLQGFTSLSESLDPERLTELLNDYLSAMTDIVQEEGGTLDKYQGDAIMAFWNAPISQSDHALRAVRTALRCQQRLESLQPEFLSRYGHSLSMRIGIHTGVAVVGNMGSHTRFDYTVLGDAVNLAARLEGVNKRFASGILVSDVTREQVGEALLFREVGRVAVVGRGEAVTLYQPLAASLPSARQQLFSSALGAFHVGDFGVALSGFLALIDQDPVAAAYVKTCLGFVRKPPTDWNGVWRLDSK
jgi:adenylate cyclase